jgi:DNA polymerase-3 subunit gamma/tau
MVLIRMAYAAELPTPSDLVRKYQETKPATQIASQPAAKAAPEKPRPISSGNAALDIRENPNTAQTAAPSSMPSSFREIVALFEENREGALHAQLYGNVHPVRCEKGLLEIKLKPGCPTNLASRVGQCLTQWTGQRWMISVVDKEGFPTLEDEAKTAERKRREKAMSHPLMQTTMLAFPDAKLLSLKQKPASAETGEGDEEIAVTDFEEEN